MSLNEREWFTEIFEERSAFSLRYSRKLFEKESQFQRIEILDTVTMGRALVLGGCFMLTERDAFIYHEMLVHPALSMLRSPRRVLVIGGGDGGAVTEVVKYASVESVILCEIDPLVVSACREHLPDISAGLSDPRVDIVHEDGAAFARRHKGRFDAVFVDSTDPVGPAKALFEKPFYESVKRSLAPGGIAVFQTESPLFMEDVFKEAVGDLRAVFGREGVRPYLAVIPCYPGGLWSFTFCRSGVPASSDGRCGSGLPQGLRYCDGDVCRAAFSLPPFVKDILSGDRG